MGCYGRPPDYHINILPCIPDCDTTVSYSEMVEYVSTMVSGGTTGSGTYRDNIIEMEFGYLTTSPLEVFRIMPSERVVMCRVEVFTPFNGSHPTVTVGDDADQSRLMGVGDSRIKKQAIFEVAPDIEYTTLDTIKLYLDSSSSTTGSGVVILEIDT
jgi:hypothetical protein